MPRKTRSLTLLLLLACVTVLHAQDGTSVTSPVWTWVGGSQGKVATVPSFGTQGVPSSSNFPGSQSEATTWTDASGDLWLFGGSQSDSSGTYGSGNDLWRYSPSTSQWTWMGGGTIDATNTAEGNYGTLGVAAAGNLPPGRLGGVGWTDASGNFWLFGGTAFADISSHYETVYYNDLWKYSTATNQWTWMGGSDTPTSGGFASGVFGTKGTPSTANIPSSRYGSVSWTDNNGDLWLMGGSGVDSTGLTAMLNDLWRYSPTTGQWTWITGNSVAGINNGLSGTTSGVYGSQGVASTGNTPGARVQGESWIDASGNFWLFGGWGSDSTGTTGLLNDLWEYSASANTWTWVSGSTNLPTNTSGLFEAPAGVYGTQGTPSASNVPGGRYVGAAWTDASGNFWLFGGVGADSTDTDGLLNDVWVYSPSGNTWTWMGGSTTANATAVYGAEGVASASNTPGSRAQMLYWTDATHNLWLFGGLGGSYQPGDPTAFTYYDLWTAGTAGGASSPAVTLSPSSLSFSSPSGTAAVPQTVTLTNSGNADLTGIAFGFSNNLGGFSAQSTCPSTLSAGDSCTFTIGFTPPGIVTYTNALLITDNAPNSPQSVGLTGTGTGTLAAAATTYPTSLTFNPTLVNTTNSGQSITLYNTGGVPLTGITPSIIGTNASDFAISSNTCTSLALGAACTISVTFTPPSTGTFNATLSIADNAVDSPQSVPLSGTGAATLETASIGPSFLGFADQAINTSSAAITVTLANAGTSALTDISPSITGPGASAFAISSTDCGTSVAAASSCSISITFTPNLVADFNATLVVTDDADNSPHVVPLSGAGITASTTTAATLSTTSLTFPNTPIGTGSPLSVTLTNTGTEPLSIEGILFGDTYENEANSLSAAQNVFAQTSNCGSTLAVGANCTITVTFTPTAGSLYSGTLLIADTSSGFAQSVSLTGVGTGGSGTSAVLTPPLNFGSVAVNTTSAALTATLTNTGSAALTGITPSLSSGNASNFAISANTCGSSLAAGASCTLSVIYTAPAAGQYVTTLNVADSAPGSPQAVALQGGSNCSGTPPAMDTACNPGGSVVDTSTQRVALAFTPANVTTATATADSTEIIGNYQGTVVYDQTFPAAYGSPTVQAGVTAANAAITAAGGAGTQIPAPALTSTSTSTSTASASIYSRDPAPPVSTQETTVAFGPTTIVAGVAGLSSNPTALNITECTEASLPDSTVPQCFATDPGSFQVLSGQEALLTNKTETYFIDTATTSTITTTTSAVYAINGTAASTPAVTLIPAGPINFSATSGATSARQMVTLTNSGAGSLTITGISLTGANASSFAETNNCPASLAANASCTISITFTPATATSYSASLSITDNATGSPQTVTLTGTAATSAPNPGDLDWTWMDGSSLVGSSSVAPGNYGTLGVPASTNLPPGRDDPETWTDKSGNFWMMGGSSISQSVGIAFLNDLWEYSPSTLEWTWQGGANSIPGPYGVGDTFGTQGTPSAQSVPGARAGSLTWTDPSGNLWLYGGYGVNDGLLSPTPDQIAPLYSFWKYTPSLGQWTWIAGTDYSVSADVVNSIPTYGVMGTPSSTNFPGARAGSSTWTDSAGNLWMFGGDVVDNLTYYSDGFLESAIDGNDLWKFDPTSQQWTWEAGSQITSSASVNPNCTPGVNGTLGVAAPGNTPSGRGGSSSWTDSAGNLWLFGGQGCGSFNVNAGGNNDTWGTLNDLWKFNTTTNQWTWVAGGTNADQSGVYGTLGIPSAGNTPGERESAYSWTDKNGKFWLFGGSGYDSNGIYGAFNDLWMFDPSTTEWTWEGGSTTDSGSASLPGIYGTLGVGAAGNMPGARDGGGAWTDTSGNLWLFGGAGEDASGAYGDLNDLWEYSASQTQTSAPQVQLSASTLLPFSSTVNVASAAQSLTVSNNGSASLSITGITITGTGASDFAQTNNCGITLAVNAQCSISITFTPAAATSYTATLSIADNVSNSPQTVTLTGTGTAVVVSAPVASLTPAGPLTFTAAAGSTSAAQAAMLTNTGNAALSITSIAITGTNASSFAETNTCGASLAAGSNCSISITFAPGSAASFTASLSVADNAGGSPQTISLSGAGTALPTFTLSSLTSTGTVSDTTAATYQLTVTPQNGSFTSPISLTASGVPSGYTASFKPASVTPGSSPATAVLTISKSPTAMLERTLPFSAPALALMAFFFVPRARRRRLVMLVVFAVGAFAALTFSGCGGGFGLPTTTYNVTITASGGGATQTTTVQLTVRQ